MKQQILVYGKCGGYVTIATFLGNQWWVTNRDEKLEPLYDDGPYSEHDYRYLCEVGELVQMRDLAGMMGAALEMPEGDIKEVLNNRLKENAKDALNWAKVFVEFFLKHGVRVCVTLHCTEDVLELLNGQVQNMKIEIDNLFDKPNEQ